MKIKPIISFEDFAKLDIRIGKIIEVERVPETDKLYRLQVDFGPLTQTDLSNGSDQNDSSEKSREIRQIVSGIADRINVDDLSGMLCPFILNLEPRTIRGVQSNGMILAVGSETYFALLNPHVSVKPGASVR